MKATQLNFEQVETALGAKLIANGKASQALHETLVGYRANRRSGNHATLTKAMVNGSGAKPWRQKGTGRARAGSKASPVWVGGGVAFGPQPRDYSKKISKNTKKTALKRAISSLAKEGRILSVDSVSLKAPKTSELVKELKAAGMGASVLIVTEAIDNNLLLASRNVPKLNVVTAEMLNAEDLVSHKQVLIVKDAMSMIAKRMS